MNRKYLIFVVTTLDDLKNERKELPRLIMELGHIPVMPEFAGTGEEADRRLLVRKTLEECDYCLCLLAHKYLADGEKTSPAEAEYVWAAQKGIPFISLILDGKARWKASKREADPETGRKLEAFREKLKKGPFAEWTGTADLRQKAQSLLIREMNLNPRPGWIYAAQTVDPSVANELSRLSGENEELKRRIKVENSGIMTRLQDQMKQALKVLALNKATLSFHYSGGENWENPRKFRYLRIWKLLVPELSPGKTTAEISRFLGNVLNPDLEKTVRKDYPTPSNTIKKIMADFALLRLAKCSAAGDEEVWEITGYGRELYAAYRMHLLERAFKRKP
ncbi:MAG: DUF4062 domain-containing protein [Treponema sp.]|jgi:hypothetical protein|nr:DUF4062 domain-containing protein [Treponema sp.]